MWGQLRKGIGENVIAKIGDVVAPPTDEDYEYDDNSGSEGDYYEEEEGDDVDDEEDDDASYDQDQGELSPSDMRQNVGKLFGGFTSAINQTAKNLVKTDDGYDYDEYADGDSYDEDDADIGNGDVDQDDFDDGDNAWNDDTDEIDVSSESFEFGENAGATTPAPSGNDGGMSDSNAPENSNGVEEVQETVQKEEPPKRPNPPPPPPPLPTQQVQPPVPKIAARELVIDSEIDGDADPFGELEESNLSFEDRPKPDMHDVLNVQEEEDARNHEVLQAQMEKEAREVQDQLEKSAQEEEQARQKLAALEIARKEQEEMEAKLRLEEEERERKRILAEEEEIRLAKQQEEKARLQKQEEEIRLQREEEELREKEEKERIRIRMEQEEERARIEAEQDALRLQMMQQEEEARQRQMQMEAEEQEMARLKLEREEQQMKQEQENAEQEKAILMAKHEEQIRIQSESSNAEILEKDQLKQNNANAERQQDRSFESGNDSLGLQQYMPDMEMESKLQEMAVALVDKDGEIEELRNHIERYKEQVEQKYLAEVELMNSNATQASLSLEMKDAEIESLKRHFEEFQQQINDQHSKEIAPLQDAINRAMLELDARDSEISNLRQHFAQKLESSEARQEAKLKKVEQNLINMTKDRDSKNSDIKKMRGTIKELRDQLKSKEEEHDEVDKEADELNQMVEDLEASNEKLKERLKEFEGNSKDAAGLQIELQLVKEERDREIKKVLTLQESKESSQVTLSAERDAAKAQVLDLEQRLATSQADLRVAKADYDRAMIASSNLQSAMEAFESEREAEFALFEENRLSTENSIKAAHELALESMKQENNRVIQEVQIASNKAVTNMMEEMTTMEAKQEEYRKETVNLRRSLDEAISRLQSKEEDVIDRALMKSILLDWHSKSGRAKRDVLMVMSSILNFDEKEKQKCGLVPGPHNSISGRVAGSLALPVSGTSPEDLDGDNIREKWVNFLLSEVGDVPVKEDKLKKRTGKRSTETTAI